MPKGIGLFKRLKKVRKALNFGSKRGRLKNALANSITFTVKIKKMNNNAKYGVVDIGSNSVRAILYSDGKILYKTVITTRLGEGLANTGVICESAFERTLKTVQSCVQVLISKFADQILIFATETVRSAKNGVDFALAVKESTGFDVDVVKGEEEGELGLLGALAGKDGGIIDIGGASAEIVACDGGKIVYSHSLPLGAVRLYDACGENLKKLDEIIDKNLDFYGKVPQYVDYYAIGGTATTIGFIDSGVSNYDEKVVDGREITVEKLEEILKKLTGFSLNERIEKMHINPKRAEIIVGGAYMLKKIMQRFNIKSVKVSESDNLLGYLRKKIFGESYEKQG